MTSGRTVRRPESLLRTCIGNDADGFLHTNVRQPAEIDSRMTE